MYVWLSELDPGGNDGGDAGLRDGNPVPVETDAGDDSSDAAVSADAKRVLYVFTYKECFLYLF